MPTNNLSSTFKETNVIQLSTKKFSFFKFLINIVHQIEIAIL